MNIVRLTTTVVHLNIQFYVVRRMQYVVSSQLYRYKSTSTILENVPYMSSRVLRLQVLMYSRMHTHVLVYSLTHILRPSTNHMIWHTSTCAVCDKHNALNTTEYDLCTSTLSKVQVPGSRNCTLTQWIQVRACPPVTLFLELSVILVQICPRFIPPVRPEHYKNSVFGLERYSRRHIWSKKYDSGINARK
jgi:hypothetical protein